MPTVLNKRNRKIDCSEGVRVMRPSILGNPFRIGIHGTREECVFMHRQWLKTGENFGCSLATKERREKVLRLIPHLKGRDLVCCCAPEPCHATTLMEMANQ